MIARTVHCVKLKKELPGMEFPPMPGALGERLWREVSQEAWKAWLGHATMVINENRLNPSQEQARAVLAAELEKFFFGPGVATPAGYTPPKA